MAYADQRFRHDLRNILNCFTLGLCAYEISNNEEKLELLEMIEKSADDAIAIIDNNPPSPDLP